MLRAKMGKAKRDKYLRNIRFLPIDYLPERAYKTDGGFKAIPRKGSRDFYMLFLHREVDVENQLSMQEGETFVDVGANVGFYTLTVANTYKSKGVKVVAIEAHPDNYNALCRNIRANHFANISAINKAVSDHKGVVTLYELSLDGLRGDSDLYTIETSLVQNNEVPSCKPLQLGCDTLDNIIDEPGADVMKVDIEGAEILALKGATNTLKRLRKVIVEIHGDNLFSVKRLLEESHFKLQLIQNSLTMPHIIGSK
jgi:FkbM family methyltransferase